MNHRMIGWLWVAGQAVLLGALILLPGRDDWATPAVLLAIANILFFSGLGIIAIGALGLGAAITPTPVPAGRGSLITSGFYRHVRHPIYTGVLAVVSGMTLRSGSWFHLVIAVATVFFFDRKSAWEENKLAEHYPGYQQYAAVTPKFVPQPWRTLRRR